MTKFAGKIGYGHTEETKPGVYEVVITERKAYGDVIRNSYGKENGEKVNNDLTVGNSISIVSDTYASLNASAMRYVQWMGALWIITNVSIEPPRMVLRLGEVYNGPTP